MNSIIYAQKFAILAPDGDAYLDIRELRSILIQKRFSY